MTTAILSNQPTTRWPLAVELSKLGLRGLPEDEVHAHMRDKISKLRPTLALKFSFGLFWMLTAVNLQRPIFWVTYHRNAIWGAAILGAFLAVYGMSAALPEFFLYLSLLPFSALILSALMYAVFFGLGKEELLSEWIPTPLRRNDQFWIPDRLCARIKRVQTHLPSARIVILEIGDDPIIEVRQEWGPFSERVKIGAFGTGKPKLDDF